MRKWIAITLAVFGVLYWCTFGPVFGAERRPVDRKTFNAAMDKLYPSGRGPNSTSRGRGLYRGLNGDWKRR
jgi:hypothetical protein